MTLAALTATLASWTVIAVVTSALLAIAAWSTQHLLRRRMPARLAWSLALGGAALLTLVQPLRTSATPQVRMATAPLTTPLDLSPLPRSQSSRWAAVSSAASTRLTSAASSIGTLAGRAPRPVQWMLVAAWPATTALLLGVLFVGYRRQRHLTDTVDTRIVDGAEVHITEAIGPMVVGVREPRILVPRWLADREDTERALAIRHERSHVDAGDPALLVAGCITVALMPWNLPAWAMLSRLRLAIEIDCDARVLSHERSPRRYAELLLAAARIGETPAPRTSLPRTLIEFAAPSLFPAGPSQLERRIRAMTARPPRFTVARGLTALTLAASAVMVACSAELPTAAEVERMDVASTERRLSPVLKADSVVYLVDGKPLSREVATAIRGDSIATVNISRLSDKINEIRIATKTGTELRGVMERELPSKVAFRAVRDSSVMRADNVVQVQGLRLSPSKDDSIRIRMTGGAAGGVMEVPRLDPLYIVDGVKRSPRALQELPVSSIASVEVIKGAKAQELYGAEGANGVIIVKTKK